ncbi:3'-5' exonuclease [Limisalsivibrio acetivorans]|uniref:3'-5' exonuclease n=1 Tax=Limisalsivibrio acetivorans TaxID=1304888 RepID=UPI0003B620DB|nr:3'-5' exonuclease [Limisalsivibrio acetivorans]
MITKLFGRKSLDDKPQDPITLYVRKLCEDARKNITMDDKLEDAVFSVVDTETTGLDINEARVINIAAVKVQNFKIVDFYNTFINPEMLIPPESIKWHNITDDMVQDKPYVEEVLPDFLKFIGSSVIVGHHINFDIKMINKEMQNCFGCQLHNPWLDTMLIYSRSILKKEDHHTLDHLFDVYKVTCNGRHTALGDALATAEVFTKMVFQANKTYGTVKELSDSQKSFVG